MSCSCRCTGCPARSGRHPEETSRRHASSRASWRRCAAVRVSSGPSFLSEGVQDGVQVGRAAGGQVPGQPARAAEGRRVVQGPVGEPVIGAVVVGGGGAAPDLFRELAQCGQVQAGGCGGGQDRVRVGAGACGQEVGPVGQLPRPRHRHPAPGQRPARAGCSPRRRAHVTAAFAAGRVIRDCQVSHVRADPWPSSSNPRWTVNADSTFDRAATSTDSARSRSTRVCASVTDGWPAQSACASTPRPASTDGIPSDSLAPDSAGVAGVGAAGAADGGRAPGRGAGSDGNEAAGSSTGTAPPFRQNKPKQRTGRRIGFAEQIGRRLAGFRIGRGLRRAGRGGSKEVSDGGPDPKARPGPRAIRNNQGG